MSGVFDKIKKSVFGEKMPEKAMMKVTMLGARGVGKTSVITSMYNNTNVAVSDTKLHIAAEEGTKIILQKKLNDLKQMFLANNGAGDMVQPGIAGDNMVSIFEFTFGLNTEKINIGLELRDFPGEYLIREAETVKEYIKESSALLIAVDTPHMMECDGRYNEGKNRVSLLTQFFKETLNSESDEKLIMLIPLKCEKYYHDGKIDEVTNKVKEVYRELLTFLRDRDNDNGMKGKFACVIAPILTAGEIVFERFEGTDGRVTEVVDSTGNVVPAKVTYRYLRPGAKYSPQFCEQPLLYLLSFISKLYLRMKDEKSSAGLIVKLKKLFELTPQTNQMLMEIQKMSNKKNDNVSGYVTCFGRGKI